MDNITTAAPNMIHDEMCVKPPVAQNFSSNAPITPLDLVEGPKVRTKLRLYAILLALYVN